jgi:hypothetical protein
MDGIHKTDAGLGRPQRNWRRLPALVLGALSAVVLAAGCEPKQKSNDDDRKGGIVVTPPTALNSQTCLDNGLRTGWHPGLQDQYGWTSQPYNWGVNPPSASLGFCGCPTGYQATCFPGQGLTCLPAQPIDGWWYDLYSWDWNRSDFGRSQYYGSQGFWYFTIWYWGGFYWEFASYDTGWERIDPSWYPTYGDDDRYETWNRDRRTTGVRANPRQGDMNGSIWQRSRRPVTQSARTSQTRRPGLTVRVQAPWASVPQTPNTQAPTYGPITPTNPSFQGPGAGPQQAGAWWSGSNGSLQCQAAVAHGCDIRVANSCGASSVCRTSSPSSPYGVCVSATRNGF